MSSNHDRPVGTHLVGSVPLNSSEEVFRLAAAILGDRLRRIPDGETGERINWIGFQLEVMGKEPALERVPPDPERYAPLPRMRLREGSRATELRFDRLGYTDAALDSYRTFARLVDEGTIARGTRFQVSLPTPLAPVAAFVAPESQPAVERAYEGALLRELSRITDGVHIPRDQLAIQWDVAVEFGILEGIFPNRLDHPFDDIVSRLIRLGRSVPEPVELGYHLCYGDFEHRHFKQPADAGRFVAVINRLGPALGRSLQWVHVPVPRDRTDEAYFAPLRRLELRPETELYLGLVHATDGRPGAERRIEAARGAVDRFGVATECGLGRRPAGQIEGLLALHRDLADPLPERARSRG